MATYLDPTNIVPRLGGRPLTATSDPNTTQVGDMLDEAEAELLGHMEGFGIPTAYSAGTRGFLTIRGWIANYVGGLVRSIHAAAAGDGTNDDGQFWIDKWRDLFDRIRQDPDGVATALSGTGTTPSGSVALGSHVTDADLDLSETDLEPVFRKGSIGERF